MPELPEMETYRRLLLPRVQGQRITNAAIGRERSLNVPSAEFVPAVVHRTITDVERRAKHLLFHLDNGMSLLLHLMLGGVLYWGKVDDKPNRTVQITLTFEEHNLYFIGLRLGYLHLHPREVVLELMEKLGPEPMEPDFVEDQFCSVLSGKRGKLKTVLTDQTVIAGIGNCYSDEICHEAGLRPDRTIPSLNDQDGKALYRSVRAVLAEATEAGGYMELPLYAGDKHTGGYNDRRKVYDREDEACYRCKNTVVRQELASRKSFFCPVCQR